MSPPRSEARPATAPTSATPFDRDYYEANEQSGDRPALRLYSRVAHRLAPRGATALEFGSGTGHFSRRLATRFRSLAYDISPYALEETSRTSPATRLVRNLGELAPGSVDLVCSLHVLEHVPEPSAALSALRTVLRLGGVIFYVVPDPDGLGHRLRRDDWFAYRDPTHCSLLPRREWLSITERAGFAVERTATDGLWDPPYIRGLPARPQLYLFGLPAALQLVAGRLLLPVGWGECLCLVARAV